MYIRAAIVLIIAFAGGCDVESDVRPFAPIAPGDVGDVGSYGDVSLEHAPEAAIYDFANTCVTVATRSAGAQKWLRAAGDDGYAFTGGEAESATKFFMKASDLGTYLFYDESRGYLVSENGPLLRQTELQSDVYKVDDTYISGAEWQLEFSERVSMRYQLRSRRTGQLLGNEGLVTSSRSASALTLEPAEGCTEHPEMALNATGSVEKTTYDDGTLFGYVDAHSHILSNFGFGAGGIMHGSPFHRLGVEVAMGDCELFHGPDGRADFLGWGFGEAQDGLDELTFLTLLNTGLLPNPWHATDGWPTFSDWPSQVSATHQTQYYRWLERAWMSGLRMVVLHAVSNDAFCQIMIDTQFQPARQSCDDMVNIDREIVEAHNMERYIDAQAGGPGEGFFRLVKTPEQAREVVAAGKMAVVLGIEVPNLFDCYLTPRDGSPECNDAYIESQLDRYYDLGIRVMFPNHKYDNAFTPGDGHRGIVEIGNFVTTGHWSDFVEDCPDVNTQFDSGRVQYGGLNEPRDMYLSPPPNELIRFTPTPLEQLLPYLPRVREPALNGDWCQKAGLTDAGRTLISGMMDRGMIPELDHLPRRSYADAFAMLEEANYPGAGTHNLTNNGKLYELGGISKSSFRRCSDPAAPGDMASAFRMRRDMIVAAGKYPAEGFAFDLNGLAGVPDARFGPDANCATMQENPVEYPFTSYAGDVTFTQPVIGERVVDFNTEGMIDIGLVPELIEDARRTGVTDEDLDIVFKSAEGYIRMWELAVQRAGER